MPDPPPPEPTQVETSDALTAGLAAAFGPHSDVLVGASVLKSLRAVISELPRVQLRDPDNGQGSPIVRSKSQAMPPAIDAGARLQLLGEIARGGMGAILKGRDVDIGRDVAVKVMLDSHTGRPELLQRFVEEAQISGQLQHPGVVPVYELGQFPDRRPYFTMKLVKGKTLAALLHERQAPTADWPKFLAIFEQVCQTLAYAHARGVIHRDVKPSNVMVGNFGEVQLMDWGLSKVLAQGGVADERQAPEASVIRTARSEGASGSGSSSDTQAGAVLGTPAYMAPEQARGDVERVDERADVFGLGAILCEILTGDPPYTGRAADIHARAKSSALDEAHQRLDRCSADVELVALAKRCLAEAPSDRPRHAGAVAAAITAFRESAEQRLRQAELAGAEARARAVEERKRRRLTLALAASVLSALVVVGGAVLWVQYDRGRRAAADARREAHIEREAGAALQMADELQRHGRFAQALAAVQKAEGLLDAGGSAALRRRAETLHGDLDMLTRLDEIRLRQAEVAIDSRPGRFWSGSFNLAGAAPLYAAAFRSYGIDLLALDESDAADRIRQSGIRSALVGAIDDWRQVTPEQTERQRLLRVAQAADPQPDGIAAKLRALAAGGDREQLRLLASRTDVDQIPPSTVVHLADVLPNEQAIALLRTGQLRFPNDYWINFELSLRMKSLNPPRRTEAIRFLSICEALRDAYYVSNNLGILLLHENRLEEAESAFRKATRLKPDYADAWNNLGNALKLQSRVRDALAAYGKAIELQPGHPVAENYYIDVLQRLGQLDQAADELRKKLTASTERPPSERSYLHFLLGRVLAAQNRPAQAVTAFRQALDLTPDANLGHYHLGKALLDQGKRAEANAALKKAEELSQDDPDTLANIGTALAQLGEWSAAASSLRRALELKPYLADAHSNLAVCLMQGPARDLDGAQRHLQLAIEREPGHGVAHQVLGVVFMRRERWAEAEALLRRSIELNDSVANFHCDLGIVLRRQGKSEEAIEPLRRATALEPGFDDAHHELGLALLEAAEFAEARSALERALALLPADDSRRTDVEEALRRCEPGVKLEEKLSAVLQGKEKPSNAAEQVALGDLCRRKRMPATAARLFTDAFAAQPKLAESRDPRHRYHAACTAALAGCGRGKDAFHLAHSNRTASRKQALHWLRAELAAGPTPATLHQWLNDADLAVVRLDAELAKLPADEGDAWRLFWNEVKALQTKASSKQ